MRPRGRCDLCGGAPDGDPFGFRRALGDLGWECDELVVADRFMTRLLGLTDRRLARRGAAVAMGFPDCGSVHTCFMSGAIDVAFLDGEGSVLAVFAAVPPWRVLRCRGARSVLERLVAERLDGGVASG